MKKSQTLGLILFALICISPILAATVRAEHATSPLSKVNSSLKPFEGRDSYLPVVPPEPRPYDGPVEYTMGVYNVATSAVTEIPCNDPSQIADEPGIKFTEPYAGLLSSDVTPETVFPPDGRTVVSYSTTTTYPWRTVCKIYMTAADGTKWMGSAAIVGPGQGGHGYFILTAGHCVYMAAHGGWVSSIEVIAGYDGAQAQQYQSMPYYHAWVTNMWTYNGWIVNGDWNYDMAFCSLDRNLGDYTGWMGRMTAGSSNSIYTGILNTAGYPGDKDSGVRMYFDSDYGRTATEYKHWYYMDTYEGQSGSPVWYYDGTSRYILTVHAYGDDGSGSNSGTRFNTAKFNDITTIMNGATPPTDKADLLDDGQSWSGFSPTTVTAGVSSFQVWNDVRNFGTAASGGFYVDYYASTNTIISPSDYLIGWDYISNVNAFAYADSDLTVTFPSSVPPGTYWVGWIIDSLSQVPEFDETNNIAYKSSYQLTVIPPTYALTIQVSGSGTTNPAVGTYTYNAGTNVQVNAYPSSGWILNHWELDGSNVGSANPYTVTMNSNHVLKAVFTQIVTYDVTIVAHCNTEGVDLGVAITMDGSPTGFNTPHMFSVTGSHTFGVPAIDTGSHPFSQWNIGEANTTITVTSARTYTAYYGPSFTIWTEGYKTTYHIGETMKVYVRVRNPGPALPVRAKIFLKLPSNALYGPLLDMNTTLPANYDSGKVLWQTFTIPTVPLGNYAWIAELRNPSTNALISQSTWSWQLSAATSMQIPTANVILQEKPE